MSSPSNSSQLACSRWWCICRSSCSLRRPSFSHCSTSLRGGIQCGADGVDGDVRRCGLRNELAEPQSSQAETTADSWLPKTAGCCRQLAALLPDQPTHLPCSRSAHCTTGWAGGIHRSMSASNVEDKQARRARQHPEWFAWETAGGAATNRTLMRLMLMRLVLHPPIARPQPTDLDGHACCLSAAAPCGGPLAKWRWHSCWQSRPAHPSLSRSSLAAGRRPRQRPCRPISRSSRAPRCPGSCSSWQGS